NVRKGYLNYMTYVVEASFADQTGLFKVQATVWDNGSVSCSVYRPGVTFKNGPDDAVLYSARFESDGKEETKLNDRVEPAAKMFESLQGHFLSKTRELSNYIKNAM